MNFHDLTLSDLLSAGVFCIVALLHWFRHPRLPLLQGSQGLLDKMDGLPLVSVIVPARNEAHQIGRCVQSLLGQDYPRFEVIVVDDCSDDETNAVVSRLAERDKRLRLVHGVPLPADWLGKAHAVQQGYRKAAGQWLLFTDADTVHAPFLLSGVMSLVLKSRASFATVFPRHVHPTFGVYLTNLSVFTYISMMVVSSKGFSNPSSRQSMVNGQYLLVSRDAYEAIGTHEAVRFYSSTDVSLGYLAKLDGWIPVAIDGRDGIQTTMYRSFIEAFSNWSRSLVNGNWTALGSVLGSSALLLACIGLYRFWIYPWIELAISLLAVDRTGSLVGGIQVLAGIAVLKVDSQRWATAIKNCILMPVSTVIFIALAVIGLARACVNRGTIWKGRTVQTRRRLPKWKPKPARAARR